MFSSFCVSSLRCICVFVLCLLSRVFFFFFKQKTAYEMRISDWSSDVCSSDLPWPGTCGWSPVTGRTFPAKVLATWVNGGLAYRDGVEIGRASCRERVCQYV